MKVNTVLEESTLANFK